MQVKAWKKRWFELDDGILSYYTDTKDPVQGKPPLGRLYIANASIRRPTADSVSTDSFAASARRRSSLILRSCCDCSVPTDGVAPPLPPPALRASDSCAYSQLQV